MIMFTPAVFVSSKRSMYILLTDDKTTFEEDNSVWEVTVDNQVFIHGAKGIKDTKWYQAGTKNGGQIEVAGQKFEVEYQAVNNAEIIEDVPEAFNKKIS